MNELMVKDDVEVENMIYEIRGVQVMLDSDLAKLYQCKNGTKEINQAVKRNVEKFPGRYCFQLTRSEYINLKSQIVTSSLNQNYGGVRKLPYVFTEQGVAMLATILKTSVATKISIQIMDAFVSMRKYLSGNLIEQKYINNLVLEHDSDIKLLQKSFDKFTTKEKNNHIFFEGQIYDAYSLLVEILNKSRESIIIIDNYIDKKLLDVISKVKREVKVITTHKSYIDVEKYLEQYNNLEIVINNSFHDRFILIDNVFIPLWSIVQRLRS